jgi:hypothetical protein
MSKSWIVLIVIAIITMLAIIGFEFYQSVSGANVQFTPKYETTDIAPDLGRKELLYLEQLETSVEVRDETLNRDVTPTPATF